MEKIISSGFADEISPELDKQLQVVRELGMDHISLRSADGKGIAEYTAEEFADKYYSSRLSEGMGMIHSYMPLLDGLLEDAIPKNDDRDILIILDEFDSGLSLDNIDIVMNKIIDISIRRQDIQFIFSFNNPFILHYLSYCGNMLLSMYNGKPVHIVTDSGLLRFYRRKDNTRKFNKRRFDEDGEYIIY